jgi:hypothetical protein
MSHDRERRSDFKTAVFLALGALLLLLVGLGIAAFMGDSNEPSMIYEGF